MFDALMIVLPGIAVASAQPDVAARVPFVLDLQYVVLLRQGRERGRGYENNSLIGSAPFRIPIVAKIRATFTGFSFGSAPIASELP